MSEQEKKSSGNITGGSSLVMVEQTTGSRHKQPYRPTEMHEEPLPDVQHKRSRAPAVPTVEEELKDSTSKTGCPDQRESERGSSIEKQKQSVAKKLSVNSKRRETSPEPIKLAHIDIDRKRDFSKHLPQPIPVEVKTVGSDASARTRAEKKNEKNDDDDSITEEIAVLRNPEVVKKSTEWNNPREKDFKTEIHEDLVIKSEILPRSESAVVHNQKLKNSTNIAKRNEISWADKEYEERVVLQGLGARSQPLELDRRASVGPCFRTGVSCCGPSGISICLPRKSTRDLDFSPCSTPSGINITVSKKVCAEKLKSCNHNENANENNLSENCPKVEGPFVKLFGAWRGKIYSFRERVKNVFDV